jgi:hypothetical protein
MEIGGKKVKFSGVCPASQAYYLNSVHDGIAAGRACWVVENTLCDGQVQGTFANKISMCQKCSFFYQVRKEEGEKYVSTKELLIKRDAQKRK